MKPLTAAKKLGIYLPATPEEFQQSDLSHEQFVELQQNPPEWLADDEPFADPTSLLLTPDHPTPLHLKTHTTDPVPYLLVDSRTDGPGGEYTEPATTDSAVVAGHDLMSLLLSDGS